MRNCRHIWLIAVLLVLCQRGWAQDSTSLSLIDRGGFVRTTSGAPDGASVGYARLTSQDGTSVPSGLAIFGLRKDGILVTETTAPASLPVTSGRIYTEVQGAVRTGLAIVNPNSQAGTISFFFTDELGANFGASSTTIPANRQIARFLDESPFSGGSTIVGTFTFTASLPVAATALRIPLTFTITNGILVAPEFDVNFSVPNSGVLSFNGTVPDLGNCSFSGQISSGYASGNWSCLLTAENGASGTWSATGQ